MNKAWSGLEKAPPGSFKNKIHRYCCNCDFVLFCYDVDHVVVRYKELIVIFFCYLMCSLGLSLLSRVKPSEIFLKSIPKQLNGVEVVFPSRFVLVSVYCDYFFDRDLMCVTM